MNPRKARRTWFQLVCSILFFAILWTSVASASERRKDGLFVIGNTGVETVLTVGGVRQNLKGRVSLHAEASPEELKQGLIEIKGLGIIIGGVDQIALTGKETRGSRIGSVGMAANILGKPILFKYDERTRTAVGTVPLLIDFPQLTELTATRSEKDKVGCLFASRRQAGAMQLEIRFERGLNEIMGKERVAVAAEIRARVRAEAFVDNRVKVRDYGVEVMARKFPFDVGRILLFTVGRELCLQPVRFRNNAADISPTGQGLAFGLPGAQTQWGKADIRFAVRNWILKDGAAFKNPQTDDDITSIRASQGDPDCIDIFFVESFNPVDKWGGGATWGGGTASSKIVSSDGNATGGIDFTHLSHELGHVLDMGHPGDTFGGAMVDPSTGTLMCPSGWHHDNPTRNSQLNGDSVSNPLLTYALKRRGARMMDCTGSVDCGACPF